MDVSLEAGKTITMETNPEENVFIFLVEGDAVIANQKAPEKTAVLFSEGGDAIEVSATPEKPLRFMYFGGKKLKEPVSWGGPIVMNTEDELFSAFQELEEGTFIKENAE